MARRPDVVLDWRPKPDPKNALWLVSGMDCYSRGAERSQILRTKRVYLNQRSEGACTGFGAEHVMSLTPYPVATSDAIARSVYYEARRQDEWEGEDYEGSSVNGAMKAERLMGRIKEWRWCWTMAEVRHALSYHGAVEAGTWWWTGMFEPDADGMIHITGYKEGGHAYALAGWRVRNGQREYRIENSWGADWGVDGGCWISEFDLSQLMGDDGEFACPLKVRP